MGYWMISTVWMFLARSLCLFLATVNTTIAYSLPTKFGYKTECRTYGGECLSLANRKHCIEGPLQIFVSPRSLLELSAEANVNYVSPKFMY